jgi:thiol:disulfide interchange protein DsbD
MNLPDGGPVSTEITYENRKGVELAGMPASTAAPVTVHDEMFNMDVRWYSETVTFIQKIRITDPENFALKGEIQYMACNDEMCLPPENVTFTFDRRHIAGVVLPSAGDAPDRIEAASSTGETARSPVNGKENTVAEAPVKEENAASAGKEGKLTVSGDQIMNGKLWTPVIDELAALGDATVITVSASKWRIFLAGFIGGLIALLTPCVWPVIPMTVSFFLKRNRKRTGAFREAALYALSIIIIYLTLGLLITGIFGAGALNSLSTNALFNILFCALLLVFAFSFFGAFELSLPSSWTNRIDARADAMSGFGSIFFMAFTLALVSFSCTGPIIGTLLVEAASGNSILGPATGMFGFALALAIPFALFAVFPHWMKSLPKSGGWLNTVKVTLGFLEIALALKFFSVADLAYGWRILDREVFLALWITVFGLLGYYLLGNLHFRHDDRQSRITVPRLSLALASFAFSVYLLPGLWGAPLKAVSAFAPPLYTQDFNLYTDEVRAVFDDYETGMAYAEKVQKPVLIDFSGYGCVNCRKMEAAVWTAPPVKALIEDRFVLITLMVDDRSRLPQPVAVEENGRKRTLKTVGDKWSCLQRYKFRANAQPFYIILDADGKPLSPAYGYREDVEQYVKFLENGLKNYAK